ncbi:MAG: HAD hydrolase-like protein [Lactobacillus sp.]|jgi:phosphoglycolate phosphatase|nr:HAD hydrolase-like protein [Lactobacillus sp.]
MTVKHLICDWDETLVHTLPTVKNAYDAVFDYLNMGRKSFEEIKKITGGKAKSEIFSYMLFGKGSDDFDTNEELTLSTKDGEKVLSAQDASELAQKSYDIFYDYINKNHIKELKIMEGALEFLNYCKAQNISLYILSSKSPEFLKKETEALKLDHFFTAIYGSPAGATGEGKKLEKPNIDAFLALFGGNPPPAELCCVIGDGKADEKLAENIGCPCIIVNEKCNTCVPKLSLAINRLNELNRKPLIAFTKSAI